MNMQQPSPLTLSLAANFTPVADLLTSEGLITFGVKGSGKSNLVALLVEQLAKCFLPQVILDSEREYLSLLNYLPNGVIGNANRCPSGYDILHKGLQVIVDLRSWDTDEAAALAVVQLVDELFSAAQAQTYQDRVPCPIHLDEAGYWLPQLVVSYLSKETRKALADAFHKLATRGRKLGLVPFLYTQSISEVAKPAIRQAGVKVLMRQTLDLDLKRYAEYIRGATAKTRRAITAFPPGKAIVLLPDGRQLAVQFAERQSKHVSQTPMVSAAVAKFAAAPAGQHNRQSQPMKDTSAQPAQKKRVRRAPVQVAQPLTSPIEDAIFAALTADSTLAPSDLMRRFCCSLEVAKQARSRFFTPRIEAPRRSRRASHQPAAKK